MLFQVNTDLFANYAKLDTLQQWHCRLGHINIATIKTICTKNLADGINLTDEGNFFCVDCSRGKMKRSSHKNTERRAAAKCEYFHMDLCGPMTETGIGGVRYFMLLKDDSTCFR